MRNDKHRTTKLHQAVQEGHLEKIKEELQMNTTNINAVDDKGNTALHCAVMHDDYEVVELLLAGGADPKLTNARGRSSLDFAVSAEVSVIICQYLEGNTIAYGWEDVSNNPPLEALEAPVNSPTKKSISQFSNIKGLSHCTLS